MKKLIIIFALTLFCFPLISQNEETEGFSLPKDGKKGKGERLMWGVYTDLWQGVPDEAGIKSMNQGAGFHWMFDIPVVSKLSFAVGAGLSCHNLYSSSMLVPGADTNFKPTGKTVFSPIPDSVSYKRNKFNVNYVEIPLELRFRSAGSEGFKIALGFKAGLMMSNHTKYKGDGYVYGEKTTIKEKSFDNGNILDYRYGVTGRIGYKWINLSVFYSLTNLFEDGKGPEIYPVSVGMLITPF